MKATMRKLTEDRDGNEAYEGDVVIKVGKRKVISNIGDSLTDVMSDAKRVEISDEYFPGASEYKVRKSVEGDGDDYLQGGFIIEGKNAKAWACAAGLRRLGIRGTVNKTLYVKIRR